MSGNWKTILGETLPLPWSLLCFSTPISWKETPSGDEGCEWEDGDCVWYPLDGLPGLGLALPDEPAYRMTPPPGLFSMFSLRFSLPSGIIAELYSWTAFSCLSLRSLVNTSERGSGAAKAYVHSVLSRSSDCTVRGAWAEKPQSTMKFSN